LVKALRYQSDCPGIDSRWCHWGFFPWFPPTKPCALGSTQPLKMSTRDFCWGKGGRCVELMTYHPCSAKSQEIWGLYLPGTPWATSACRGRPLLYFTLLYFLLYFTLLYFTLRQTCKSQSLIVQFLKFVNLPKFLLILTSNWN